MDATGVLAFSVVPPEAASAAQFLLLGGLAAVIMGAAKAGFGGSIGMLSTPILLYACGGDAALALGAMLPLLIACDYVAVVHWRRQWHWRSVALLLPGFVLGTAGGAVALWALGQASKDVTNASLKLIIGGIAVGFVALQGVRTLRGNIKPFRPDAWYGLAAGTGAGVTSMLTHAAGPITSVFFLSQNMPKRRFVATTTLYYWIGNQVKLLPYAILGLLSPVSLRASLGLAPAVIAGALLGIFLHHRVNQKAFSIIVYGLLGAIGTHFVITSAAKLWF